MSFDNSRNIYNSWKDYLGMITLQGRVQLDSDWNDFQGQYLRRMQAGTLDIMGRAVYPAALPNSFLIQATVNANGANQIQIGAGRMYVDGLLAENHGPMGPHHSPTAIAQWDPVLAELSNTYPPGTAFVGVDYFSQPYYPDPPVPPPPPLGTNPSTPPVLGNGPYVVYLDVWQRAVTWLEDHHLREIAVGVDTTGRLQTVWQVKLLDASSANPALTCETVSTFPGWLSATQSSGGQLTTALVPPAQSGPCILTPNTGYTGMENQFYRVEIHKAGAFGTATFKWSRENASVMTSVLGINNNATNTANNKVCALTVESLGRDQVLGFTSGYWIELLDDHLELQGQPGELYLIDSVAPSTRTITLATPLQTNSRFAGGLTASNHHARIRRWDQQGIVYQSDYKTEVTDLGQTGSSGDIPLTASGIAIVLENGVTASFSLSTNSNLGTFQTGDFWTFAARTANSSVEILQAAPPRGIHHHYAVLAVVANFTSLPSNCRIPWPPQATAGSDSCGCCTWTVGPPGEGDFQKIQDAINKLRHGGEICLLPGDYYENVVLNGCHNVVISGCSRQTRVFSAALKPGATTPPTPGPSPAQSGLTAVFTAIGCTNLEFRSFSVHAASGEAGILLDRGPDTLKSPNTPGVTQDLEYVIREPGKVDTNVIIENLLVTAFNFPAITAVTVKGLKAVENRIVMSRVDSLWPAVYLSGDSIFFERNWIGLEEVVASGNQRIINQFVVPVTEDVRSASSASVDGNTIPKAPGGIQIAGPSNDVFIVENEIVGGIYNGITLGNLVILDSSGKPTNQFVGLLLELEGPCVKGGTQTIPPAATGTNPGQVVAGDVIRNLHIDRNRIHDLGMCGIGPVGFWDFSKGVTEVISLENVFITANIISRTLQRSLTGSRYYGGGAICLPDVQNVTIRDNVITDFGATPGAEVCGIFLLIGEVVDISRNQIKETRDLASTSSTSVDSFGGIRAGILVWLVMPSPQATPDQLSATLDGIPLFAPGIPALRIQENMVRVAIGMALEVAGFGPFEISNNHFGSGGGVQYSGTLSLQDLGTTPGGTETIGGALTVAVLNLGISIEIADVFYGFSQAYANVTKSAVTPALMSLAYSSNGAVLFTNNICQLEALSGVVGLASVFIATLDHVLFANNQLWLNGNTGTSAGRVYGFYDAAGALPGTAWMDAFIFGITTQVCTNRFQESFNFPVLISGLTLGPSNITSQNISTYCLVALPTIAPFTNQNLALWCSKG